MSTIKLFIKLDTPQACKTTSMLSAVSRFSPIKTLEETKLHAL